MGKGPESQPGREVLDAVIDHWRTKIHPIESEWAGVGYFQGEAALAQAEQMAQLTASNNRLAAAIERSNEIGGHNFGSAEMSEETQGQQSQPDPLVYKQQDLPLRAGKDPLSMQNTPPSRE